MKLRNNMFVAGVLLATQFATHGAEVTVTGDIIRNTTWTKDNVYILDKSIFVKNGATLTIEAGTWVLGTQNATANTRGSLVITRDGKIDAVGTKNEPIVFTAKEEYDGVALDPSRGDGGLWGGLIVLGNAPINFYTGPTTNANEREIEGFPAGSTLDIRYGGRDSNSDSGRLKYVSIRFGGYEFAPNEEINGLTLGGVGRRTEIENIEVISNTDDGIEIFGGTVNLKRAAVAFCQDDSLDLDCGYQGNIQFFFSLQNADGAIGDRGGEWDGGNGEVKDRPPYTTARIFNATIIGDGAGSATDSPNHGIYIDDNFAGQLVNSVITDFSGDMVVDSGDGIGAEPNPLFSNCTFGLFGGLEGSLAAVSGEGVQSGIDPRLTGISRTPNGGLNPIPAADSPLRSASRSPFPNGFFEDAPFRGAFGDENWLDGWSYLSQKGYLPEPVLPGAPDFTVEPKGAVASKGDRVILKSAAVAESGEVTYQWFRNGTAIGGATTNNLAIDRLTPGKAGEYFVEASVEGITSRSGIAVVEIAELSGLPKAVKAKRGKAFTATLENNFDANQFTAAGLPRGLKISNRGVISGKPVKKGSFKVKITGLRVVGSKKPVTATLVRRIIVR